MERVSDEINSKAALIDPTQEADIPLLEQYASQISDYKSKLSEVLDLLLSLEESIEVEDCFTLQSRIEQTLLYCSRTIQKEMKSDEGINTSLDSSTPGTGVRLPKLAIPTFDGNLFRGGFRKMNLAGLVSK